MPRIDPASSWSVLKKMINLNVQIKIDILPVNRSTLAVTTKDILRSKTVAPVEELTAAKRLDDVSQGIICNDTEENVGGGTLHLNTQLSMWVHSVPCLSVSMDSYHCPLFTPSHACFPLCIGNITLHANFNSAKRSSFRNYRVFRTSDVSMKN